MRLVSYAVKEDELNYSTIPVTSSRYGWLQGDMVVDAKFAEQWLLHESADVMGQKLPDHLLDLLREGMTIWRYLREMHQFLSSEDISQLHYAGEPVAIELSQVDLLAPILNPPSIVTVESLTDISHAFQHVPYLSLQSDSQTEWMMQWGAVIGGETTEITLHNSLDAICGYVLLIHAKGASTEKVYIGPFLRTKDEWVDLEKELHFSLLVDGKQHLTGQLKLSLIRLQEAIVQRAQTHKLLPGEIFALTALTKPISLNQSEDITWSVEDFGDLHVTLSSNTI